MGAAMKGRNDAILLLVERGADLAQKDKGSRDTDKATSSAAGHRWQAIDYADGLVRVGVQSAVEYPETSALIRKLMVERGMAVPPIGRNILSVCVVALCAGQQLIQAWFVAASPCNAAPAQTNAPVIARCRGVFLYRRPIKGRPTQGDYSTLKCFDR